MVASLILGALASVGVASPGHQPSDEACWKLDNTSVTSGGCITMILDNACASLRGLRVQIDDREPDSPDAYPMIICHDVPGPSTRRVILISHDLRTRHGFELVADEPETYRMKPVFDEPGTVRVTLLAGNQSLGTKVVNVVPVTPEAQGAVDLLFPTVVKDQGPIRNWAKSMTLLVGADHVPDSTRHGPDLLQLKRELEVLRRHPDWAEIFEMLIVRLEARIELSDLQEKIKTGEIDVGPESEPPPPAPAVANAMGTKLKSAFARAIQDSVREVVRQRKFYLHNPDLLRSEDE